MSILLKNQAIRDAITLLPTFMAGTFSSVNYYTDLHGDGECRVGYNRFKIDSLDDGVSFNQACYAPLWTKDRPGVPSQQGRTILLRTNNLTDAKYFETLGWLLEMHPEYLLKGHDKAEAGYVIFPEWKEHNGNDFARFIILLRNLAEQGNWETAYYLHKTVGLSKELSLNLSMLFSIRKGRVTLHSTGHAAFQPAMPGNYSPGIPNCSWPALRERLLKGGLTRNNPESVGDRRWSNDLTDHKAFYTTDKAYTMEGFFSSISVTREVWGTRITEWDLNKFIEILKKEFA